MRSGSVGRGGDVDAAESVCWSGMLKILKAPSNSLAFLSSASVGDRVYTLFPVSSVLSDEVPDALVGVSGFCVPFSSLLPFLFIWVLKGGNSVLGGVRLRIIQFLATVAGGIVVTVVISLHFGGELMVQRTIID